MKKQTIKAIISSVYLTTALMLSIVNVAQAADTAGEKDVLKVVVEQLAIVNPSENYGVNVGDQLIRHISFSAPKPYKLTKNSLPKKSSQSKGLELVKLKVAENFEDSATDYQVTLVYQVFINPGVPSAMQLPALTIPLTGGKTPPIVSVPSWKFWFAPLVVGNNDHAAQAMQADVKPPLLDTKIHKNRFIALFTLMGFSLLALLYMNADGRWLPFMGGAFARAHRQLKKLSKSTKLKTPKEEKQALVAIHQAFNHHYGANIFSRNIEHFFTIRPSFAKMNNEINAFFEYSNKSLYSTTLRDSEQIIKDSVQLSKELRDCERGV